MTLEELLAQARAKYQFAPEFGATFNAGFDLSRVNPMYRTDDVGNSLFMGYGVDGRPLYQDVTYDTGEGKRLFEEGVLSAGDSTDALARKDVLQGYAGRLDQTLDLIRKIDPSATEEEVFQAASRVNASRDAPGQYMPGLRIDQLVADEYLSSKAGRPVTLESIPQFREALAAAENQASNTKLTWQEAAPILMMFAAPALGPALAGAYGSLGLGATASAAASGATLGAANALMTGDNVLKGAALGGVAGGFANAVAPSIQSASQMGGFVGLTADQAQAVARAAQAAGTAALRGADPMTAALSTLAGSAAGQLAGGFTDSPMFIQAISNAASAAVAGQDPVTAALGGAARGFTQSSLTPTLNNAAEFDAMAAAQPDFTADFQRNNMAFMPDILGDETGFAGANFGGQSPWDIDDATTALNDEQWAAALGGYLNSDATVMNWQSGSDLPSGVYNIATGQFSPTPEGMTPGDYIQLPNGSVVPAGTLAGSSFNVGSGQTATQAYQNAIRSGTLTPGSNVAGGGSAGGAGGGENNNQQRALSAAEMAMLFGPSLAAIGLAANQSRPDLSALNRYQDINVQAPDTSALQSLLTRIGNQSYTIDNTGANEILSRLAQGPGQIDTSALQSAAAQAGRALTPIDTAIFESLIRDSRASGRPIDTSGIQAAMGRLGQSTSADTSRLNEVFGQLSQSQGALDTSRLRAISDRMDPNAAIAPFDADTAAMRGRLLNDQGRRQIAGSSFADQSLASFDAMRSMARNKAIQDALSAQAGVEDRILGADAQTRSLDNQRLGTAAGVASNMTQADLQRQANDTQRLQAMLQGGTSLANLGIQEQQLGLQRLQNAGQLAGQMGQLQLGQQSNQLQQANLLGNIGSNLANASLQGQRLGLDYLTGAGSLYNNMTNNQLQAMGLQNQSNQTALQGANLLQNTFNNYQNNQLQAANLGLNAATTGLNAESNFNRNQLDLYGRALGSFGNVASAYLLGNNRTALMPSLFGSNP